MFFRELKIRKVPNSWDKQLLKKSKIVRISDFCKNVELWDF